MGRIPLEKLTLNKKLCVFLILVILYYSLVKDLFGSTTLKYRIYDLNPNMKIDQVKSDIWVIDNFYLRPDLIVKKSKEQPFYHRKALYSTKYYNPELLEFQNIISFFESLVGKQLSYSKWNKDVYVNSNGFFQYIVEDSKVTVHCDGAEIDYGVVIFLDKNPVLGKGTSFYRHKKTGHEQEINPIYTYDVWREDEEPKFDKWEKILSVNNLYNRALIFNSKRFHCSDGGYGTDKSNARYFQTYFFGLLQ